MQGETSHELRFLPNFYPLPAEMLQSLDQNVKEWKQEGRLVFSRDELGDKALADLKQRVIAKVATN